MRVIFILILSVLLVSSCATKTKKQSAEVTAQKLYDRAVRAVKSSAYDRAIQLFQALESQFPFENFAAQAQLELIYVHFKKRNYIAAKDVAERFIRLHPAHHNVDYAYYMKGIISYHEDTGISGHFFRTDVSDRDLGTALDSYSDFAELLSLFPNSIYAVDARKRMVFIRNLIARKGIHIANYYIKRGAVSAALARAKYTLENFQGSPSVPDALAIMAQCYLALGYEKAMNNTIEVLRANYPEHPALDNNGNLIERDFSKQQTRSLFNRLTLGFIKPPTLAGYDSRNIYNEQYTKRSKKK